MSGQQEAGGGCKGCCELSSRAPRLGDMRSHHGMFVESGGDPGQEPHVCHPPPCTGAGVFHRRASWFGAVVRKGSVWPSGGTEEHSAGQLWGGRRFRLDLRNMESSVWTNVKRRPETQHSPCRASSIC